MHRTDLKGVNFGSSASKMRKLCVIGSPEYITVFLKTECNNRRKKKRKEKKVMLKKKILHRLMLCKEHT